MPKRILNQSFNRAGHLIFWLASICFMLFFFYFNEKRVHIDLAILSKAIVSNMGFALGVYINLYVLIPKFLKLKKYIFYIFWLIVLLTLSSLVVQFILIYPLQEFLELSDNLSSFDTNLHAAYFFATLIYISITSFLKFIKDWLALQGLNLKFAKIEQQKLEAELKTLKSQLNPHFLFNSLNNIYSLSLVKSDKVPELILKLSDLMRHIIYESKENFISLRKEIEFVDNFISLQKIRISNTSNIKYKILGEMPEAKIIPLIFEPFIDNAFKHGLPYSDTNDFINILLDFRESTFLTFKIENNYEELSTKNKGSSGIGIANVKQRLNYLYNSTDYKLTVNKENSVFSVFLRLKLK